tara:strand:- start:142 stop:900 length:759 start_codon:yes stop_codon:yes gene_type:complete
MKNIKTFNEFMNESQHGLGRKVGDEMISYKIPTRDEALALQIGDQVIDKTKQYLGVGTLNYFNKDKSIATVQFYDSLKGSAYGNQGQETDVRNSKKLSYYDGDQSKRGDEIYDIDVANLFAVLATDENYIDSDFTASTNHVSQQTRPDQVDPEEEEDDFDKYNPSKINKFAHKAMGDSIAFVSKKRKTPGSGIQEGGLGDNEVAGQRVFTQTVDQSKQGYQDAMYYEDDEEIHDDGCECDSCVTWDRVSTTE